MSTAVRGNMPLPPEGWGWILPADAHAAGVRLQVYRDGYPARIGEALRESYPAVARILGPLEFDLLATRYAQSVRLRSYNLNDAGRRLPEFLRRDRVTMTCGALPDLARLEWLVTRAFHARQRAPLDPRSLADRTLEQWSDTVFRFQPALAVVSSRWPLRRLWQGSGQGESALDLRPRRRATHVLVRRAGFGVRVESLSAPEARGLAILRGGATLGEMTEALAGQATAAIVAGWFTGWMARELIVGQRIVAAPAACHHVGPCRDTID